MLTSGQFKNPNAIGCICMHTYIRISLYIIYILLFCDIALNLRIKSYNVLVAITVLIAYPSTSTTVPMISTASLKSFDNVSSDGLVR